MKEESKWGGARTGAGRPKGTTKKMARRNTVCVRLNDAELTAAHDLGGGNAAEGVRRALIIASRKLAIPAK